MSSPSPARSSLVDLPSESGQEGPLADAGRYFAEDITEPFVLDEDGHLPVPTGPGIGTAPLPDALRRCTRERRDLYTA
ncbi:mandelate racemase/muconate lactonizing enzyme family protein [Streptomyces tricolor]|uniref:mandelate racemase/muconate lactonizing enzyme family protein n=1 Tax=Streptomyces tricolor TaxID=68277 RepID=UPI0036E661A9